MTTTMSDLSIDLQEAVLQGDLSFDEIARMFEVPRAWVIEAARDAYNDAEREVYYDELERDYDEPYEPEGGEDRYLDSYYEDQYDLGDF